MIILVVAGGTIVYISIIALLCSCRRRPDHKIKVIDHEQVAQTTEMNQDDAKDSQRYGSHKATSIELEELE